MIPPVSASAPSQAEVEEHEVSVGAEDQVRGLEVAMKEVVVVDRGQGVGDLQDPDPSLLGGRGTAPQDVVEGLARDEVHDQVEALLGLADLMDRDHARVADAGQELGLATKARPAVGVGPRQQELERALAREVRRGHGVDDAHSAPPELSLHFVVPDLHPRSIGSENDEGKSENP